MIWNLSKQTPAMLRFFLCPNQFVACFCSETRLPQRGTNTSRLRQVRPCWIAGWGSWKGRGQDCYWSNT